MSKRDIGNEILQSLQDIKEGKGHKKKLELSDDIKICNPSVPL